MEKLGHMIKEKVQSKLWKTVKFSCKGPEFSHLFFADDLVLFSEASVEQARVVANCLNEFYEISGEKISTQKSKIIVSKNTLRNVARSISEECRIPLAAEFGKYLGAIMFSSRVGKETYKDFVAKVKSRLVGWKMAQLSMAGRVTLIKAVSSAIPTYTMQTTKLPEVTCKELDKCNRNFIWGHDNSTYKMHLVSWEQVCKEKKNGGLHIRSALKANEAILAKLGWKMFSDKDKMLENKYIKEGDFLNGREIKTGSHMWKSICKSRELVRRGCNWRIGNGQSIKFWTDIWVGELALADLVQGHLQRLNFEQKLRILLLMKINSIPLGGEDVRGWRLTTNGEFNTKTAYHLVKEEVSENIFDWQKIWKTLVLPRIQQFMWIAIRDRLLTNVSRRNRGMSDVALCLKCNDADESTLHILCDCPVARNMWLGFGVVGKMANFFDCNHIQWFEKIFGKTEHIGEEVEWRIIFATGTWSLWKWRNKAIFESDFVYPVEIGSEILRQAREQVENFRLQEGPGVRKEEFLRWIPPPSCWVKLNVDGCVKGNLGSAGTWGIIQDHNGRWEAGFVCNLEICHNDLAEMWGIQHGLELPWSKGFRLMEVESDSSTNIQLIKEGVSQRHLLYNLVEACHDMWKRSWEIKLVHAYRECSFCADYLANLSITYPLGVSYCESPSGEAARFIFEDLCGVARSRFVV